VLHLLDTKAIDVSKIVGGSWSLEHWHDAFETMHSGKIAKAVLEVQPDLAA
jgi:alcohol dehydrogenase/L-iditol 2-dehydrogenase